MAQSKKFSYVGKDVTISYQMTSVGTVEGEVVEVADAGVTIQYESRGKLHTEFLPNASILSMNHREALEEKNDEE